jgi:hypothetical protein
LATFYEEDMLPFFVKPPNILCYSTTVHQLGSFNFSWYIGLLFSKSEHIL